MFDDARTPQTGLSPEAAARWSACVGAFLAHGRETPRHLTATLEAAPGFALGHAAQGLMLMMLGRRERIPAARAALARAREAQAQAGGCARAADATEARYNDMALTGCEIVRKLVRRVIAGKALGKPTADAPTGRDDQHRERRDGSDDRRCACRDCPGGEPSAHDHKCEFPRGGQQGRCFGCSGPITRKNSDRDIGNHGFDKQHRQQTPEHDLPALHHD